VTGQPVDALLAVTYRCNARCRMCNIWRTTPRKELEPKRWSNIPSTLREVNVSGGEPFLRDDLPEIVSIVRAASPKARIIISSNGIDPKRISMQMRKILEVDGSIGVGISIDGLGEVHDRVRGVTGAYAQAVETVKLLKGIGVKDLRIAFTAFEENSGQMTRVYDLSRQLGVEFSCVVAHDSEIYFKVSGTRLGSMESLADDLSRVAARELRTFVPKRWARSYFYRGLTDYMMTKRRLLPCMAGRASLFIDPEGEVYPCNVLDMSMGNIMREPFAEVWDSERANEIRLKVRQCNRPCWMMCSVRPALKKNLLSAGLWVARNKPRVHLTRRWRL
jgi:radical SAM protein with 4Fe4S-binding SPASM domain